MYKKLSNNKYLKTLLIIIILILVSLNLFVVAHYYSFTSDDVSWQTILQTWSPFNKHVAVLGGSDNYILRLPLMYVFNHIFGFNKKALFIEGLLYEYAMYVFFFVSTFYFFKHFRTKYVNLSLIPILWLSSFGISFSIIFLNSNLRSFEVGFSFLFFALSFYLYKKNQINIDSIRNKLLLLTLSIISGIFIFNDPYFLYFTVVPIIALFIYLYLSKKIRPKNILIVLFYAMLSYLIYLIIQKLVVHFNIIIPFQEPVQFVSLNNLSKNITTGLKGVLLIFGANFFGYNVFSLNAIDGVLNSLIILIFGYILLKRTKIKKPDDVTEGVLFFGFLGLFNLVVYMLSNIIVDITTYRYLIMLVLSVVMMLSLSIDSLDLKTRKILILLLSGAIFLNFILTLRILIEPNNSNINSSNTINLKTVRMISNLGIDKGYASYWNSDINQYLSKGKIKFLPVYCLNNKTVPFYWLVDRNNYSIKVKSSFIIIDPTYPNPPTCDEAEVIKQFGIPKKIFTLGQETILIYNYDIIHSM